MNATQTKIELQKVDTQLADLELWHDRLTQARRSLLTGDEHDQRIVRVIERGLEPGTGYAFHSGDARRLLDGWNGHGLQRVEHDLAEQRERRQLLEEQLPSAKEVAKAKRLVAELVKQAEQNAVRFGELWAAFMESLSVADPAARDMVEARIKAQLTIRELSSLVEQYGLDADVPREPTPDPDQSKLAGLIGLLLQNAGYSQVIEKQLDAEVASARPKAEREAKAA